MTARAPLKIYLGYAPHTGKTWRLLEEARRRKSRGEDVVVGWIRKKDKPAMAEILAGLELLPPCDGTLDVEAILQRRPHVCVIDELAYANPPTSRNRQRWEDVQQLLAAGIAVVTALNIQYIDALRGRIRDLLGKAPEVSVPDELVRSADEIVVVDASPDPAIAQEVRCTQRELLALRELALLYSASAMEEEVQEYKHEHHIEEVWETQERILVCITAYSRAPYLIERASLAARAWKGELWTIYVTPDPEWSNLSEDEALTVRGFLELARSRGSRVMIVENPDPARGILEFAREHEITQIFLGHAAAYPFRGALSRTVAGRILHEAAGITVQLISDEPAARPTGNGNPGLTVLARLLSLPARSQSRGHLRIYLGYAPGVGKTSQMLSDGRYLRDHGQNVIVGFCDARGRPDVDELKAGLEDVCRLEEIVRRRPQVCLVDNLAERLEDVEVLLDAGVHVFTTLDVAEVESLKDTVQRITDVRVEHTVPDWVVDEADEVIFVDAAIKALLNRVKRGAVFNGLEVPPELRGVFTEGSLCALRELAMRLTADQVEQELQESAERGEEDALLVCVHHRASGASAIRRARRTADRLGAPVYAVYVARDEDWSGVSPEDREVIQRHLDLARSLHIDTHELYGSNIARTVIDFAVRHGVSRIFLGRSHKTGWREFFQRSVIEQVIRYSPGTDIIVVAET